MTILSFSRQPDLDLQPTNLRFFFTKNPDLKKNKKHFFLWGGVEEGGGGGVRGWDGAGEGRGR